ncbi:hypothetical protein ABZ260_18575, partial [Streptosporangium sp. NPDC006013]|uniref:hypothetical protein n=1 Tax=Streptosporangium sp. NPDC006013 TaxID=3155596 RepID=UPI0033AB5C53
MLTGLLIIVQNDDAIARVMFWTLLASELFNISSFPHVDLELHSELGSSRRLGAAWSCRSTDRASARRPGPIGQEFGSVIVQHMLDQFVADLLSDGVTPLGPGPGHRR